jgi:hypothetical protein
MGNVPDFGTLIDGSLALLLIKLAAYSLVEHINRIFVYICLFQSPTFFTSRYLFD